MKEGLEIFLIFVLVLLLIGSIVDLFKMSKVILNHKETLIEQNHFYDYLTQVRLETTQLIIILGFLLIWVGIQKEKG